MLIPGKILKMIICMGYGSGQQGKHVCFLAETSMSSLRTHIKGQNIILLLLVRTLNEEAKGMLKCFLLSSRYEVVCHIILVDTMKKCGLHDRPAWRIHNR